MTIDSSPISVGCHYDCKGWEIPDQNRNTLHVFDLPDSHFDM